MEDLSNEKILIFSDTHLTCKFNEAHFQALKEIILEADKVIINGDFWEYIACDFESFVNSEWAEKLFPLLKEKNTVFLHGNHDQEKDTFWDGIKKFADERDKDYKFKSSDKIFKIEHGDLIATEFNQYHRTLSNIVHKFLPTFYLFLINYEYKKNFLGKILKKMMDWRRRKELQYINIFSKKNLRKKVIRIFGHIHLKKHNLKDNFIILGEFRQGVRNYIFIENGEIKFFSNKY